MVGGLLIALAGFLVRYQALELPLKMSPLTNTSCSNVVPDIVDDILIAASSALNDRYGPECGGPRWKQVASINMTQPNSQCPSGWTKVSAPVTACSRDSTRLVSSATFSTGGLTYSSVCGRIVGYQLGQTDAFGNYYYNAAYDAAGRLDLTIAGTYLDGVSITHGPSSSRQHIWSFAAGESEQPINDVRRLCPCSVSTFPEALPAFIGNHYFCDSGNTRATEAVDGVFYSRALWTGNGCASASRCCQHNIPPWFYATLAQATSDDLEVRLISNLLPNSGEDVFVSIVELYVK